jgi:uncharacterized protein (DUF885 family)
MDETQRAHALADRFWDELLEIEPLLGTEAGDPRFDDKLPDASADGRARTERACRAALTEADALQVDELEATDRGTIDVLRAIAERFLAAIEHRTDHLAAASHMIGPSQMFAEVASLQQAGTPEQLERYEARLREFPRYLEGWTEVLHEGVAAGVTSPRVVTERSIGGLERLLAIDPHDSPALAPLGDDAPTQDRERVIDIVRDVVNPAHAAFLTALQESLPHATETIGLRELPGGEAMYGAEILSWTTLPLGAQEVHDLGRERLAAITQERTELAAELGFASANEAVAAHDASGENKVASREALLGLIEDQVARSWEAAPTFFGLMPSANCRVLPVEEYREADMPLAYYFGPTEDGSRPGTYYVNGYDLASRPLHQFASITFHEANPGHHFQIAIEQEMADRPALRRFGGILAGSAFAEGWGLYSERLADEMGLYLDAWERMGMLENQAHRAARLVTDTGIHALGWSREEAVTLLQEQNLPRTDAEIEADRYIAMPAQALSYMIGMSEIERARERAAARGGPEFSLREFHDRVLELGQLPLPAFQRETA